MTKSLTTITLSEVQDQLANTVVWSSSVLVIFALSSSLIRFWDTGFLPIMWLHISMTTALISIYIFRKKVSTSVKGYTVCFVFFITGFAGLHTFGLSAGGILFLYASCVVSSLILTIRTAVIFAVVGWIVIATYTLLQSYSSFSFGIEQSLYNTSPSAWFLILTVYTYLVSITLLLIYRLYNYLQSLLENQQNQLNVQESFIEQKNTIIHTIINNLPYAIRWKDTNYCYQGANKQYLADKKIDSIEDLRLIGDTELFSERDNKINIEQEARILNNEIDKLSFSQELSDRHGNITYKEIQRVALKDKENNIIGVLISDSDVTSIKQLELKAEKAKREAQKANAAKSGFLANMSHEIRTPLNGIFGLLELTLATELNEKQRNYLDKASTSAVLLRQILNDVLDISKIEANQLELESVPFYLHERLSALEEVFTEQASAKNIKFSTSFVGDKQLPLLGDPTRLMQVMMNLCSNAIKFTSKGHVKVAIEQETAAESVNIKFTFTDTGIGIKEASLPIIFNNFTQADSKVTREFGGTGLGLAIVKRLIENMKGAISVKSEPDVGTQVNVDLCLKLAESKPLMKHKSSSIRATTPLNILIVDDNEINLEIAKSMLEQQNHIIRTAANGELALACMQEQDFDAVLLDIQMPVMDGLSAIKEIRKQSRWDNLPVIALTANVMATEISEYLSNGFNDHVGKPFDKKSLLNALEQNVYVTAS